MRSHRDGEYRSEQGSELYSRFIIEEVLSSYCQRKIIVESNYRETKESVEVVYPDIDDVTFITEPPPRTIESTNEYINFLIRSLNDD